MARQHFWKSHGGAHRAVAHMSVNLIVGRFVCAKFCKVLTSQPKGFSSDHFTPPFHTSLFFPRVKSSIRKYSRESTAAALAQRKCKITTSNLKTSNQWKTDCRCRGSENLSATQGKRVRKQQATGRTMTKHEEGGVSTRPNESKRLLPFSLS